MQTFFKNILEKKKKANELTLLIQSDEIVLHVYCNYFLIAEI